MTTNPAMRKGSDMSQSALPKAKPLCKNKTAGFLEGSLLAGILTQAFNGSPSEIKGNSRTSAGTGTDDQVCGAGPLNKMVVRNRSLAVAYFSSCRVTCGIF